MQKLEFDERDLYTGLAALHWATISETDSRWDQDFYRRIIAKGNGRALELGCGAGRLHISPRTVGNHISSIFSKLHVSNRAQAIVKAREAGLGRDGTG